MAIKRNVRGFLRGVDKMNKIKIFKFCQGCIAKWWRIKGNTNYCKLCAKLTKRIKKERK